MSLPVARNPQIGPGIGADDLLVAEAVAPRYVQQRVLVRRLDVLIGADDGAAVCGQLVDRSPCRRAPSTAHTMKQADLMLIFILERTLM